VVSWDGFAEIVVVDGGANPWIEVAERAMDSIAVAVIDRLLLV